MNKYRKNMMGKKKMSPRMAAKKKMAKVGKAAGQLMGGLGS